MSDAPRSIYKPRPITGFPEWLPEERMIEQQWFDHIRKVFESYGFTSIETPSVEELEVITAKGEVDKEIYVINRLHAELAEKSESRLALHFDQTVPFARYVAQHFNELDFPFKRYQMQRVWRGERPQAGRFREFYQCDIDVINVDSLPLHFDAEMAAIMVEILQALDVGAFQMQISNRKILTGFLDSVPGLTAPLKKKIIDLFDKKEKLLKDGGDFLMAMSEIVCKEFGHTTDTLMQVMDFDFLAKSKYINAVHLRESVKFAPFLITPNAMFYEGIEELCTVMQSLAHLPEDLVVADLMIVRGLDYYTGTVYETRFIDDPTYGSICSGGRYDDLAGNYISKHLPGVGISIGFTRLFAKLREAGKFKTGRKTPTDILVALPAEDKRALAAETARTLRQNGFNVEMYHTDQKIKKQMAYAEKKGIPFVWFPPFEDGQSHEVKNMATGEQTPAKPEDWKKS